MFPMLSVKFCRSVPAYRFSVAFRSTPFRLRRCRPGASRRRDPFCARNPRARSRPPAPVGAGAVRAPDCGRETADARLASAPAEAFFGPSRILRRKAKGGPGSRLSVAIVAHFSRIQPLVRNISLSRTNRLFRPGSRSCLDGAQIARHPLRQAQDRPSIRGSAATSDEGREDRGAARCRYPHPAKMRPLNRFSNGC